MHKSNLTVDSTRAAIHCAIVGILLYGIWANSLPGQAQSYQYPAKRNPYEKRYSGTAPTSLKAPVELPDFPRYTARAYFLGGYDYPADGTVPVRRVQLNFGVHEPMEQVLGWYRDSLSSYSWTVTAINGNSNAINAIKGRNSCSVSVAKSTNPWFSAIVGIEYKLGK